MQRIVLAGLLSLVFSALHAEDAEFRLIIKNHQFQPVELSVPVGKKFKLVVENQDATAEEFESAELNREKIVAANSSIVVWLGPLEAGEYAFFGEFHQDTAKGKLIAK